MKMCPKTILCKQKQAETYLAMATGIIVSSWAILILTPFVVFVTNSFKEIPENLWPLAVYALMFVSSGFVAKSFQDAAYKILNNLESIP